MNRLLLCLLLFTSHKTAFGQTCNCDSTFKIVKYHIENNYAGWFDKNKQFVKQEFDHLTNSIAENCKSIELDSLCYREIEKYVTFFKDKHLYLEYYPTSNTIASTENTDPVQIETNPITELDILNYLKTNKQLDIAEGIWANETYKIGIIKSSRTNKSFEGVVLSSENDNWKPNEIKLYINKTSANNYKLQFITGDKTETVEKDVVFFKNILDAQSLILGKQFPKLMDTISLDDYALENDPSYPQLKFQKNDLAVWTFPNFYPQNAAIVQILLNKYQSKLATTKYWIIDLRNNEGGEVRVGNLLLPFIYTNPIIWSSEKMRLTADNFNNLYDTYIKEAIENLPGEKKKYYDSIFAVTKTHFGEFGNLYNLVKTADTLTFDKKPAYPEKVVILINENTISSGELFTLLAKQSKKVLVFGQNSAGAIDYGNLLKYRTNCPGIRLSMPSSRNIWLDKGVSIDRDKVQPDIIISKGIKNWVAFSYDKMKQSKK